MAQVAECGAWDFGCKLGDGLKNLADSAIAEFVKTLYEGAVGFVAEVSTFWMNTPSPDVDNAAVASLRADMSWYVAGFAILGFLVGLIKLVMSQDVKNSLIGLGTPIVNLILAGTAYAVGIGLLLTASDQFAIWIVQQSNRGDVDLTQMLTTSAPLLVYPGPAFFMFLLLMLGAVINLLFMYFRDVMFLILSAFIVVLAAASGSEQGRQAWRKANGWLIALLLFKPVAAGIYSLGFRMLVDGSTPEGEEASLAEALNSSLIALLILLLAALALPALIKFIVPAAGVGAGAFSGGAAIGAGVTLAAGAAVLAGTGGAAGGAAAARKGASTTAQETSSAASTAAAGKGADSSAITGSSSSGGDSGSGASSTEGNSGTVSGGGSGSGSGSSSSKSSSDSSSGNSSGGGGAAPTRSGSTGSSSASSGSSASGSGASAGGSSNAGSGEDASTSSGSSSASSGASTANSGSSTPSTGAESGEKDSGSESAAASGPSGAKEPNKFTEAVQKMNDVQNIANGANPSKLVDEDGE